MGSADDFDNGDDLFDAVGDIMQEVAVDGKDEDDIR